MGESLTADTSGIADAEGLDNVSYSYQWIRNDGSTGADIAGATGATYTVTSNDEGKTVRVRVSFTDDGGNEETLTSAPTARVASSSKQPGHGPAHHQGSSPGGSDSEGEPVRRRRC